MEAGIDVQLELTQCQAAKLVRLSRESGKTAGAVALSFLSRGVRHPALRKGRAASFLGRGVSATHARRKGV